jgi:hypothetical protein
LPVGGHNALHRHTFLQKLMKATRAMLQSLVAIADHGPLAKPLTLKHLQVALDIQGYYSGIRYRYHPIIDATSQFSGWRITDRIGKAWPLSISKPSTPNSK